MINGRRTIAKISRTPTKETILSKIHTLSKEDVEWIRERITPLVCEDCDNEIESCNACGDELTAGQKIYCDPDNNKHYCGEDCAKDALWDDTRMSETTVMRKTIE